MGCSRLKEKVDDRAKKEPRIPWQGGPHEGLMPFEKQSPSQMYLAAKAVQEPSLGPQGPKMISEVP